jgi:hypothetical protein
MRMVCDSVLRGDSPPVVISLTLLHSSSHSLIISLSFAQADGEQIWHFLLTCLLHMPTSFVCRSLTKVILVLLLLHFPCCSCFSISVYNDSTCTTTPLPAFSFSSSSQNFTNAGGSITYPCAHFSAGAPSLQANYSCTQDNTYPYLARLQMYFVNSSDCHVEPKGSNVVYSIYSSQFIRNASNCGVIGDLNNHTRNETIPTA